MSKETDRVSSFLCVSSVSLSHTSNTVNLILLTLDRRRFDLLQLEINTGSAGDILQQMLLQEVCDKHGAILDSNNACVPRGVLEVFCCYIL